MEDLSTNIFSVYWQTAEDNLQFVRICTKNTNFTLYVKLLGYILL